MKSTKPPLTRMNLIHLAIRSNSYPNSKTLAEELEVSRRTILRDIEYMRIFFSAPIRYDYDHRGFYYTEPTYMFSTVPFTKGEMKALYVAQKMMRHFFNTAFAAEMKSALEKIAEGCPAEDGISASDIDRIFWFENHRPDTRDDSQIETISDAVLDGRQLKFQYYIPPENKQKNYVANPLKLVYDRGRWFMLAASRESGEFSMYAVNRMLNVRYNGRYFNSVSEKDIFHYLAENTIFAGDKMAKRREQPGVEK